MKTLALCASLSLLAHAHAQTLVEGYTDTVRSLPANAGQVTVVENVGIAWFDGTRVMFDDGSTTRALLTLPSTVFGSFTVQVSPTDLLFAENSTGDVWLVPFRGPASPRLLANVPLPYDAVAYGSLALISAKVSGFGSPDNEVIAVDLASGQTDRIAVLPGASGALAVTPAGDLLYATAPLSFPPPKGSVSVLRFDAAKVQSAFGPTHLTTADGSVLASGLDTAGSLALDGDDDLIVVDWGNERVLELDDVSASRGMPTMSVLLDHAGAAVSPDTVQVVRFAPAPAAAAFEPFQPPLAAALVVHETQFGSISQLRTVLPARPQAAAPAMPIAAGPFTVTTFGGPRGGLGLIAFAPGPLGVETPLRLGGFEQPLFWALAGASAWQPVTFRSDGTATVMLANPGVGAPLTIAAQLAFVDAAGIVIGSAPPFSLTLQ